MKHELKYDFNFELRRTGTGAFTAYQYGNWGESWRSEETNSRNKIYEQIPGIKYVCLKS